MGVQTQMISWAGEIGERFPPRPVQIPSLLSSAESKMQLTGKEDAIDSPLLSLSPVHLFFPSPRSDLQSLFSLYTLVHVG